MRNASPLVHASPVLLDQFLSGLRSHLETNVSWLDKAYGNAQALKEDRAGRVITYPAIPTTKGDEYLSMFPDEHLGNFLWFDVPSYNVDDQGRPNKRYFAPGGIVVWGDLFRMYPSDWKQRTAEDAKNDIITALPYNKVRVQRIYDRQADIYRGYTDTEVNNQYMMRPFVAFRIDVEMSFQPTVGC